MVALVRAAAAQRVLFLPHAIRQMSRPERLITTSEIRQVIHAGEVLEDYPEDVRGHSCLMLGFGAGQPPLHIVCAPKDEYLVLITAYLPAAEDWSDDFRVRI